MHCFAFSGLCLVSVLSVFLICLLSCIFNVNGTVQPNCADVSLRINSLVRCSSQSVLTGSRSCPTCITSMIQFCTCSAASLCICRHCSARPTSELNSACRSSSDHMSICVNNYNHTTTSSLLPTSTTVNTRLSGLCVGS